MPATKLRLKHCPFCSESIQISAKKCRFCGEWLNKKNVILPKTKNGFLKKIILFVVIIGIFYYLFIPKDKSYSNDLQGFESAVLRYEYLAESNESKDKIELFNDFYTQIEKSKTTEEEFSKSKVGTYTSVEIFDYEIVNDFGILDVRFDYCETEKCNMISNSNRIFLKFYFDEGKWRIVPEDIYCPRNEMYSMPPEFSRSLSLNPTKICWCS
jgi:predicted nucleic acid-binding Zn ribbon protein